MPITDRILALLERALTTRDPKAALRALTALRVELDVFERQQVARALEAGDSFGAVAAALGISRQAAHRRYRSVLEERTARFVIAPDARKVLMRARAEAGRAGAPSVTVAHLRAALIADGYLPGPRTAPPPTGNGPGLDPELRDLLIADGQPIGVASLLKVAHQSV